MNHRFSFKDLKAIFTLFCNEDIFYYLPPFPIIKHPTMKAFHLSMCITRQIKVLAFILIIFMTGFTKFSHASHGMGGEITWTCLPSGQFKFQMKFYRDCNGIPGPVTVSLNTTVPGVPNIPLALISQTDISPVGLLPNGVSSCLTCTQGGSIPVPGLVEEFIYQSAPIVLPGIPPSAGWVFSWGECCRSSALTNITGAGSSGFRNRAVMYPYQLTTTSPCFDSSPFFTEKPSTIICTGLPFKYSSGAIDPEHDSLVYSWANPETDAGAIIPFAPGYSVNSQLPSPVQNPINVAAVLGSSTGEIAFTSFTGGYFVTVISVSAYKCGIKVAEIFREINVVLNNNCPPVFSGPNNPPVMNAPFIDPGTGLLTSYSDTVSAGDTVNFLLSITDFDLFLNGAGQTITVVGSGAQFGTNYIDPAAGCLIPPCATISGGLPVIFNIGGQINFNWVTTCEHALGSDTLCTNTSNTYYFTIKAMDNYCPANGTTLATIAITVREIPLPVSVSGPPGICAGDTIVLTASGSQSYLWNTGQTDPVLLVTEPGVYYVTGDTAAYCTGPSLPIYIGQGTIPNVAITASEDTLCYYGQPASLVFSPPGGTWTGPGINITGTQFNPFNAGVGVHNLTYTVTDSTGCIGTDTLAMTVEVCVGLEEFTSNLMLTVYPNPATNTITLTLLENDHKKVTLSLYNVYGQKVRELYSGNISGRNWTHNYDLTDVESGVYVVRMDGSSAEGIVVLKY